MQKRRTAELVCRHGTRLQSCSICQPRLSYEELAHHIDEIVEAARPRLLRLAQLNGIGPDSAEDVVQETLLEAWRSLAKLREPHACRPGSMAFAATSASGIFMLKQLGLT